MPRRPQSIWLLINIRKSPRRQIKNRKDILIQTVGESSTARNNSTVGRTERDPETETTIRGNDKLSYS